MSQETKVLIPHLHVRQKSLDSAEEIRDALVDAVPGLNIMVAESHQESLQEVVDADIIVSKGVTNELLDNAENLSWIQALSAGLDRFTTDEFGYEPPGLKRLENEGIVLTNASGIHAEPIGEQVLGYILIFERNIHKGIRNKFDGKWEKYNPAGELPEKTLGIIGVGAIGGRVAELGSDLGMNVIGTKRDTSDVNDAVDEIYDETGIGEVISRADYLVISCPLTESTRGLIGPEEIESLSSDSVLVNIARGDIVDENSLITALEQDEIRGAALDVFQEEPLPRSSPLWDLSNTVITPHLAGRSPNSSARIAEIFKTNYDKLAEEEIDSFINRIV